MVFKIGDKVVVKKKETKRWLFVSTEKTRGTGPYDVLGIDEVPDDVLEDVGHSQWLIVDYGYGPVRASGLWFKKYKEV